MVELNPVARRIIERYAAYEEQPTEWVADTREPASRSLKKADGTFGATLEPFETRETRGDAFVPEDAPPVHRVPQKPQPYHQRIRLYDAERLGVDLHGGDRRQTVDVNERTEP